MKNLPLESIEYLAWRLEDRIKFLLETEAELCAFLADEALETEAGEERPKYVTNYIGSKQKLTDWIWKSTPDDVETAVDAFSGSSVVGCR